MRFRNLSSLLLTAGLALAGMFMATPQSARAQGCTDPRGNPTDCPGDKAKRPTKIPFTASRTPTPTAVPSPTPTGDHYQQIQPAASVAVPATKAPIAISPFPTKPPSLEDALPPTAVTAGSETHKGASPMLPVLLVVGLLAGIAYLLSHYLLTKKQIGDMHYEDFGTEDPSSPKPNLEQFKSKGDRSKKP